MVEGEQRLEEVVIGAGAAPFVPQRDWPTQDSRPSCWGCAIESLVAHRPKRCAVAKGTSGPFRVSLAECSPLRRTPNGGHDKASIVTACFAMLTAAS